MRPRCGSTADAMAVIGTTSCSGADGCALCTVLLRDKAVGVPESFLLSSASVSLPAREDDKTAQGQG
jgi:hypothetical protein